LVGPIVALTTTTHGMGVMTKIVLGFVLFVGLPALVEIWWKRRRRRANERRDMQITESA
jgi:4-amino-4-deoxy-L-arabinose transferase-like glycosyltransferase